MELLETEHLIFAAQQTGLIKLVLTCKHRAIDVQLFQRTLMPQIGAFAQGKVVTGCRIVQLGEWWHDEGSDSSARHGIRNLLD